MCICSYSIIWIPEQSFWKLHTFMHETDRMQYRMNSTGCSWAVYDTRRCTDLIGRDPSE